MRQDRFAREAQILQALRRGEAGTPMIETCQKLGITERTFHW